MRKTGGNSIRTGCFCTSPTADAVSDSPSNVESSPVADAVTLTVLMATTPTLIAPKTLKWAAPGEAFATVAVKFDSPSVLIAKPPPAAFQRILRRPTYER